MGYQHLQHNPGDELFTKPSAFEIWMDKEGEKIIRRILAHPKNKCYTCESKKNITEHHIIPIYCGGIDLRKNKAYICEDCHKKIHSGNRYDINDKDWFLILEKLRKRNIYKARSNNINNKGGTK